MTNDIEIFSSAYLPSMYLLWQSIVQIFSPFFNWVVLPLYYCIVINSGQIFMFCKYFGSKLLFVFVLLAMSFKEQSCFHLEEFHLSIFLSQMVLLLLCLKNFA